MKRRLLVAVPLIAASTLLLSACGVANVISPPYASAIYATTADGAGADSSVAVPVWVQPEATLIRIKTDLTHNASILTFTVPAPAVVGVACDDTAQLPDLKQGTTAALNETWWPQTVPTEGLFCYGTWHLFNNGNQYYAWTP